MTLLTTILGGALYRLRGTSGYRMVGIVLLTIMAVLCMHRGYNLYQELALVATYIYGLLSIWGSIDPFNRKYGAGKIKQAVLDYGYDNLGVLETNCIGLAITGMLQCGVMITNSHYYVAIGLLMPVCYVIGTKLNKHWLCEVLWGAVWGLAMGV